MLVESLQRIGKLHQFYMLSSTAAGLRSTFAIGESGTMFPLFDVCLQLFEQLCLLVRSNATKRCASTICGSLCPYHSGISGRNDAKDRFCCCWMRHPGRAIHRCPALASNYSGLVHTTNDVASPLEIVKMYAGADHLVAWGTHTETAPTDSSGLEQFLRNIRSRS